MRQNKQLSSGEFVTPSDVSKGSYWDTWFLIVARCSPYYLFFDKIIYLFIKK